MDIKLTPYLSKMPTDGESVNAKKRAGLKTKLKGCQTITVIEVLRHFYSDKFNNDKFNDH